MRPCARKEKKNFGLRAEPRSGPVRAHHGLALRAGGLTHAPSTQARTCPFKNLHSAPSPERGLTTTNVWVQAASHSDHSPWQLCSRGGFVQAPPTHDRFRSWRSCARVRPYPSLQDAATPKSADKCICSRRCSPSSTARAPLLNPAFLPFLNSYMKR